MTMFMPNEIEIANFRIEANFNYPAYDVMIDAAEQQRLHAWCDVTSNIYSEVADPVLIGRLPVVLAAETIRTARPGWGQVHVVQRLRQYRPIALGETLVMNGTVTGIAPHSRGEILRSLWRYTDANNAVVFEVEPDALMINPAIGEPSAVKTKSKEKNSESTSFEMLYSKQCAPQATVGYCDGTRNPIHLDPAIAQEFGFRAPIIAGTQTMGFLVEALYRMRQPQTLSLVIGFKRPVFWDDQINVEGRRRDVTEAWSHLRALNGDGACVADCEVLEITY